MSSVNISRNRDQGKQGTKGFLSIMSIKIILTIIWYLLSKLYFMSLFACPNFDKRRCLGDYLLLYLLKT